MSGVSPSFWKGRRVLLTGHTGFKGAWTALMLERAGAEVTGFALPPATERESLFRCLTPWPNIRSIIGDLRDERAIAEATEAADPEIVIHMAAQAIVRRSVRAPVETFGSNVMGTVNLLSAVASRPRVRVILVITSDKVYDNDERGRAFSEDDALAGGDDPYSVSKAATELVVRCWRKSFLSNPDSPVLAVARGGNVIGGGDWGEDRLVPDVLQAGVENRPVTLRYPHATRPWQHVLDVVSGYLLYAERLATCPSKIPEALNFGPQPNAQTLTTASLTESLQAALGWRFGWQQTNGINVREKVHLALDSKLAHQTLGWRAQLSAPHAVNWVAAWHRAHWASEDMRAFSLSQLDTFESLSHVNEMVHENASP